MNVDYEITNELWIKYNTSTPISKRSVVYKNQTEAKNSPLASKIFGFPWVEEVHVDNQYISIKRQDWVDFDILAAPLKDLIQEHFIGEGPFEENPLKQKKQPNFTPPKEWSEQEKQIQAFLDQEVNPQVASHGGKITLSHLENTTAFIKMEGGCQGCGMAQATLRDGVEVALKEAFGEALTSIKDVTDHSKGMNPYA